MKPAYFWLLPGALLAVVAVYAIVIAIGLSVGFYCFGRNHTVLTERIVHGLPSAPPQPDPDPSDH